MFWLIFGLSLFYLRGMVGIGSYRLHQARSWAEFNRSNPDVKHEMQERYVQPKLPEGIQRLEDLPFGHRPAYAPYECWVEGPCEGAAEPCSECRANAAAGSFWAVVDGIFWPLWCFQWMGRWARGLALEGGRLTLWVLGRKQPTHLED